MKRAWTTYFAILCVGAMLGARFTGFWPHVLLYAPFVALATWFVSDYRHSDFAWWCVLNPRQSPRMLSYMTLIVAMKWSMRWKQWKKSKQKNK
jgi:hypothetical protein